MLVIFAAVGCGDSNPDGRFAVSGEVNWQGEPLKVGEVLFLPNGQGRSASAEVIDGKFELSAERGIPVGNYKVEITSYQETGRKISDPEAEGGSFEETKQILPARYNRKTELTLVVEGPPVMASFELTSK